MDLPTPANLNRDRVWELIAQYERDRDERIFEPYNEAMETQAARDGRFISATAQQPFSALDTFISHCMSRDYVSIEECAALARKSI